MDIAEAFLKTPDQWNNDTIGALFSSGLVMLILLICALIANILARKQDPLKKTKGFLFLFESGVTFFDNLAEGMMGKNFKGFGGFIFAIASYLFLAFIIGLTGLPSPVTNLAIPLSLGFMTFCLIHITSMKHTKLKYFKRYVDPFPIFLPINLLSMWAPLLSLTFRLFGNALAGWTLMSIIYWFFESISAMIFSFVPADWNTLFIAPLITPIFHAYFDVFSAFIQTTVFIMLTMLFIANEVPEEEDADFKRE